VLFDEKVRNYRGTPKSNTYGIDHLFDGMSR
jgi:hypothetical protein